MSILHQNCHKKFNRYSVYINIPVIMVSSVIGFLAPLVLFPHQEVLLGALSICVGILKTVDSYFNVTKRSETHRMTSLCYLRISRWIRLQLSLEEECRIPAKDLYDVIIKDLQNVREGEPIVPRDVIDSFNERYKDEETAKPAIVNGLTVVNINKHHTAGFHERQTAAASITNDGMPSLPSRIPKLSRSNTKATAGVTSGCGDGESTGVGPGPPGSLGSSASSASLAPQGPALSSSMQTSDCVLPVRPMPSVPLITHIV
jgi:hypothetical protein